MTPRTGTWQALRRTTQLLVVAFILIVPAVARYTNYLSARELDRKMEQWSGTLPGQTLTAIDSFLRVLPDGEMERAGRTQRNRTTVLSYSQQVRGGPWSAEIGGVSLTDPLAAAESVVLVDLRRAFQAYLTEHVSTRARSGTLTGDGVHPNERGSRLTAELVADGIARALRD